MKNDFKFLLRNIKTEQFAFIESAFNENELIQLKGSVNFGLNEIDHFIGCTTKFEFLINEKTFLVVQLLTEFEIEKSSWEQLINKDKTIFEIPVDILKHLISMNIGISRGVTHTKTEDLKSSFIFPLIDLNSLVNKPLKHKIKSEKNK